MPILSEPLSNQGFYFFAHFEGDVGLYREKIEKIFVPYLTTGGQKRIPSREGGVEVVVEELATRMVQQGHSVTCYNRGGHHVSGSAFDAETCNGYKGVKPFYDFCCEFMSQEVNNLKTGREFFLDNFNPDADDEII